MSVSSLAKGVAVGMVAGAATYALANATKFQRLRLKNQAVRTVRNVTNMLDGLGSMFM